MQTDYLMSVRGLHLVIVTKRKKNRTCRKLDVAIPVDNRVKIKGGEKRDKYLDLEHLLKNDGRWWHYFSCSCGAMGKIPKILVNGLEDLEIRGQVETI